MEERSKSLEAEDPKNFMVALCGMRLSKGGVEREVRSFGSWITGAF